MFEVLDHRTALGLGVNVAVKAGTIVIANPISYRLTATIFVDQQTEASEPGTKNVVKQDIVSRKNTKEIAVPVEHHTQFFTPKQAGKTSPI